MKHFITLLLIAPSVIVEDDDGFLHNEVGIDKDLERLLAEDHGLYMEDVASSCNITSSNSDDCKYSTLPPSSVLSTPSNSTRYFKKVIV